MIPLAMYSAFISLPLCWPFAPSKRRAQRKEVSSPTPRSSSLDRPSPYLLHYTRSQKRTYQNAMPKKTRTNSKKIRSSISFAPNRQRRPFIKRTYQAATPKEPSTNAKKITSAISTALRFQLVLRTNSGSAALRQATFESPTMSWEVAACSRATSAGGSFTSMTSW